MGNAKRFPRRLDRRLFGSLDTKSGSMASLLRLPPLPLRVGVRIGVYAHTEVGLDMIRGSRDLGNL